MNQEIEIGPYKILMHPATFQKARNYQKALEANNAFAGFYLGRGMKNKDVSMIKATEFIELLARTKRPQIFAESDVFGDGRDWSKVELSILGDISIAVPVLVFDNGNHSFPRVHDAPFSATLIFVPGALLRNGHDINPADWDVVTINGQIDHNAYYSLYERRLLPGFIYADSIARSNNRQAFITIPGIGCGAFAGRFQGSLGAELKKTMITFLENYCHLLPSIRAVYYDPYQECNNERIEIGHISFLVRPLTKGNFGKSQLCRPQDYEEKGDNFSDCQLVSFVAWDHVSWPGNDFYIGYRMTDDGVKSAATNSMAVLTGLEGIYNAGTFTYNPPSDYRNWEAVILLNRIELRVKDNLIVLPEI
ncbi:MAG: hypothetical protein EHM72_18630 [Calditrichaeota bacterium]|nr:MAG: hypothetical protein EHM72_18630 [Calditrichota bacterium]